MHSSAAVIVHYGRPDLTRVCLASLARVHSPPEIVVVDNQGDASESLSAAVTDIRLLGSGENIGFGRGANLGMAWVLEQERFDSILLLNNDATVSADALDKLIAELDRFPACAVTAPRILLDSEPAKLWYGGGEIDWYRGSARVRGSGGGPQAAFALEPRDVDFVSGCAMLIRCAALRQSGGFDPRYFLYEEDLDLGLRLSAAGWRSRYVPDAVVRHSGQGSQRRAGEPFRALQDPANPRWRQLIELQVRNRLLTMTRHAHGWRRVQFRLGFPAYWVARCIRCLVNGRPGAPRAVFDGWRDYRRLRRQPFIDELATRDVLA